ncbi:hypothetical protein KEM52_002535 [Ascosphaera acerosa]|nr:hypothetical protein KEM52_002535 [Ascosphaera acerosa]
MRLPMLSTSPGSPVRNVAIGGGTGSSSCSCSSGAGKAISASYARGFSTTAQPRLQRSAQFQSHRSFEEHEPSKLRIPSKAAPTPTPPHTLSPPPPRKPTQRLSLSTINPNVVRAKYAVRGELPIRAEQYRIALEQHGGAKAAGLPFDSVIFANIGNPQQLDQKPITFFRQVLSILENPELLALRHGPFRQYGYHEDVFERAEKLLADIGSVGAYSQSAGIPLARESVARYLAQRDGFAADPDDVFLTAGASAGVNTLLNVICDGPATGVLVPIPQYPLYTATLSVLNAECVPYYLLQE